MTQKPVTAIVPFRHWDQDEFVQFSSWLEGPLVRRESPEKQDFWKLHVRQSIRQCNMKMWPD